MMTSGIDSWGEDSPSGDPQRSSTSMEPGNKDYRGLCVRTITEEDLENLSKSLVVLTDNDVVSEYEEVNVEEEEELGGGERPLLYKVVTPEMAFKAAQQIVVPTEFSEVLELNTASKSRWISHQSTGTGGSRSCCASTIRISDNKGESSRKSIVVGSHELMRTQKPSSKHNETKILKVQTTEGASKSASSKSKQSSTTPPGLTAGGVLVKESKKKTQLERKSKSSPHESKESTAPSASKQRPRRSCTTTSSVGEQDQHDSDSNRSPSPSRKKVKKRLTSPKVPVESSRRRTASARGKSSTSKKLSRTTKKATSGEIEANDAVPECQTVVTMMDTQRSTRCGIKTGIACKNLSVVEYPCRRCHREYYCSVEHQVADASRHQPFCKVDAQLEVIPFNDEYSTWLKNSAPFLYKKCLNFVLVWPSLTVEWLTPTINTKPQLLLGTNTGDNEPNHLLICEVDMKNDKKFEGEFRVLKRITHKGEINRARHMPQNSNMIATKSPSHDVFIFDTSKFPDVAQDDVFRFNLALRGHTNGGFGVAWNSQKEGILASGSDDGVVCIWDINAKPVTTPVEEGVNSPAVDAYTKHSEHTSVVEDVEWSVFQPHVLASCGDDRKLIFWDTRTKTSALTKENAHDGDINSVSLSPVFENVVLTGGSDKTVKIWDTRRFDNSIQTIQPFKDAVMNVQFCSTTIASAGNDGKIYIMDVARCSSTSSSNESDEVSMPKECVFFHSGHVSAINDISYANGMFASVSGDNILQVWEPTLPLLEIK